MKKEVLGLSAIVGQDPAVQDGTAFAGGRGNTNAGFMFMSLKPDAERHKNGDTAQVIVDRLRPKVSNIPGAILYLQAFQDLRIGGRNTATEYQYTLTADSLKDLNEWGPRLMAAIDKLPQIKEVARRR